MKKKSLGTHWWKKKSLGKELVRTFFKLYIILWITRPFWPCINICIKIQAHFFSPQDITWPLKCRILRENFPMNKLFLSCPWLCFFNFNLEYKLLSTFLLYGQWRSLYWVRALPIGLIPESCVKKASRTRLQCTTLKPPNTLKAHLFSSYHLPLKSCCYISIDFKPFLQKKRWKCYYETCTVLSAIGAIRDRCSAH